MRVLIVDDEAPARDRLRLLLEAQTGLEVVGEAASSSEAEARIAELRPDVVMLDIELPGSSGLALAEHLAGERPLVIFCTAYERHAVDAFEIDAVDYLLKPVNRARLGKALERARAQLAREPGPRTRPARFVVRQGGHWVVVNEASVLYFAAADGLTRIVTAQGEYWMEQPLGALEARLDAGRFFRISREALIALAAVVEVHPLPGGMGEVKLKNGGRLEVSRRRFRELLEALGR